ncbi:ImmA/IrrE family metallo-endopeptidase [Methanobacterium spitsbergense]|uniref:ImmA/IrrE family metallo-endopeptidase n=1 Tax=Methanobacterium spitsbergense TaxID=2874285 RepID=A0A8T5UR72_9EURY|nr:ImmA/IrrE family metallo-endopeptidase [Methanobacterium spitsbergense]MBZ2164466.1 ImmA/IrrE family metallo-endopeptidase [Methanobacterium spitsbergense]
MNVDSETIEEWEETGEISYSKLLKLAGYYQRPPATFFNINDPIYTDFIPDLRTIKSQKKHKITPEFSFEIRNAKLRRMKILNLEEESNNLIIPYFEFKDIKTKDSQVIPEIITDKLKMNQGTRRRKDLDYWIEKVESLGVLVFQFYKVDPNEVRGYALYYDKLPVIGINHREYENGKKFTLFHELAHLILKTEGFSNFDNYFLKNDEKICNRIAAESLVPAKLLKIKLNQIDIYPLDTKIHSLSKLFRVSKEVIIRRMLDLQIISKEIYKEKQNEWDKLIAPKKTTQKTTRKTKEKKILNKLKKKDSINEYSKLASKALTRNGHYYTSIILEAFDEELISIDDLAEDLEEPIEVVSEIRNKINSEDSDD